MSNLIKKIASSWLLKYASPLEDVSKLRYQAVFTMGAPGSGKSFVANGKWLKYMPGAGAEGAKKDFDDLAKRKLSEGERSLSNLNFEKAVKKLDSLGYKIELVDATKAKVPFKVFIYDQEGNARFVPPQNWEHDLPGKIYNEVKGLTEVIFSTPAHEVPSYWRQVNPDVFKEELAGFDAKDPGYVHEMSSEMSKAYFEAAIETGDPVVVDGVGSKADKLKAQIDACIKAGYRVSLVWIWVPLTVNQIRNALRDRTVKADEVVRTYKLIGKSYNQLKGMVAKARVIDNRNDSMDLRKYLANVEKVEAFIRKYGYDSLYDLIAKEAPAELAQYEKTLAVGKAWKRQASKKR